MPRTKESPREELRSGGLSDREFSEFLLRACHDVRSPLRSMRAHAELLRRDLSGGAGAGLDERLGFIVEGGRKIDLLLDGLAAYSLALQTDQEAFHRVNLEVMLRTALSGLQQRLADCGGEVSYDPLPAVQGSPDRLVQVLENLLRNSLDHRGPLSPRIHIAAEPRGSEWLFAVRDNGPGVEPDCVESIFNPFERLNASHPGPGLGLAVCRAIVSRHGGRIWCESEPGGGAKFLFTLPAALD